MKRLALDANATVPPLPAAKAAVVTALDVEGNPSSPHGFGRAARRIIDTARDHVALALGGRPKELFFTSGATEGARWIVDAAIAFGRQRDAPLRVVTSPLEHPAVRKPLEVASARGEVELATLDVTPDGALVVDEERLRAAELLFITAAHNETGILPDLDALLAAVAPSTIVCCDAAQATARLPALPGRVDAIIASAHKMGGVAGAGAVLLRQNARTLPAPWAGGGQEGGLRPGTEPLALIAGFGAAAAEIEPTREANFALAPLRNALESRLCDADPSLRVLGAAVARLPNTSAIVIPDVDGEALRIATDTHGLAVGFGSACSALAPEPSPALVALGLSAQEARATVRISLAPGADLSLVEDAASRLLAAIRGLRAARR